MYFRSQKKLQGEVSLSDSIDTDKEGNALQLMDVVGVDDTMLEDLHDRDSALRLHQLIRERLTAREAEIVRLRYGLGGTVPLTQREIASSFGISRSYVSRIEKRALEKASDRVNGSLRRRTVSSKAFFSPAARTLTAQPSYVCEFLGWKRHNPALFNTFRIFQREYNKLVKTFPLCSDCGMSHVKIQGGLFICNNPPCIYFT